jgi:uncharacterized protein YyaL (SSP411 family)
MMLAGLSAWHADHAQVVIVGSPGDDGARALQREVAKQYRPFAVVMSLAPGGPQRAVAAQIPFVGAMTAKDGRATAYVCRNFTCREPVTNPEALAAAL